MIEVVIISFGISFAVGLYISHLKERIKKYERQELFRTCGLEPIKKRILGFLNKKPNEIYDDDFMYEQLDNKTPLDKDMFDFALMELKREGLVI